MLTIEQLNEIRDRVKKELAVRSPGGRLIVGMGTTGLAAGAREVMAAAVAEANARSSNLVVAGADLPVSPDQLPVIKYIAPSGQETLYTNVTIASVRELVQKLSGKQNVAADS